MPRTWYHYFLGMSIRMQVTMFASLVCMFCMFQDVVCCLTWCMWQCPLFTNLHQFAKQLRNIFGSCHHAPHAIFKKFTKLHNSGLHLVFIKDTEVRMGGAHIAICWLLRLKMHYGQPSTHPTSLGFDSSRKRYPFCRVKTSGIMCFPCVMPCTLTCVF